MATESRIDDVIVSEREDNNALLAHLTSSFGDALGMAPGLLMVQRGLIAGLARSQQREADRLSALLDKDHPRLQAALARARRYGHLRDDTESGLQQADRVQAAWQQSGNFFGYVRLADGSAASRVGGRLQLRRPGVKEDLFRGLTDEHGFFQIAVPVSKGDTTVAVNVREGMSSSTDTAPGIATVHDAQGRELLRDAEAPTFERSRSEMRLYTLDQRN